MIESDRQWIWSSDANLTTAYRGWMIPSLWLLTGVIWGLCAVIAIVASLAGNDVKLPVEWLTVWTGFLTLVSGIQKYEQKDFRETDHELNRIKAGASQPTNVNVTASQAQVNTTPEGKP